jgi:hypothetical protein
VDQEERQTQLNNALSASAGRVLLFYHYNDRLYKFTSQEGPVDLTNEATARTASGARNGCWRPLATEPPSCAPLRTVARSSPTKPSRQTGSPCPVRKAADTYVATSDRLALAATHLTASASRNCPRWWLIRTESSGDWNVSKFYGIIRCHQRQVLHNKF